MRKRSGSALVETAIAGLMAVIAAGAIYSMYYVAETVVAATDDNYLVERARETVIARLSSGGSLPGDFSTHGCKIDKAGGSDGFIKFRVTRSGVKEQHVAYVIFPAD